MDERELVFRAEHLLRLLEENLKADNLLDGIRPAIQDRVQLLRDAVDIVMKRYTI